jgi:hypothetical protein
MKTVHEFLVELKALFDAVAGIPGPELKAIIGAAFAVLAGFGLLSATHAGAEANTVYAIVAVLISAGVAIEKALNGAANYRASFAVTPPAEDATK